MARFVSSTSSESSKTTKNKSNLDMIGAERLIFAFKDFVLSYLPYIGLAAAKTAVLEFNVAFLYIKTYMPALDIVIVYYSIASCIAVMSF